MKLCSNRLQGKLIQKKIFGYNRQKNNSVKLLSDQKFHFNPDGFDAKFFGESITTEIVSTTSPTVLIK